MNPNTNHGRESIHRALLLIENNQANADVIESMLSESGYEIDAVGDISSAVSIAGFGYEAAVVGTAEPDRQLVDATRRLVVECPELPIVLLTTHDDQSFALAALEAGADELVSKTELRSDRLVRALEKAVMRRRRLEQGRRREFRQRHAAIGSICGYVTHEISNQAAVVLASAEAARARLSLLDHEIDAQNLEPLRALLQTQSHAVTHLTDVVRQLRALSSRGDDDIEQGADVEQVIDRVLRTIGNRLAHSAPVSVEASECPRVGLGEGRLAHVLMSLLSDAADSVESGNADSGHSSSANGSRIDVRVYTDGDDVVVAVTDRAAAGDRAPATAPTTTRPSAAGLGLAIAAEIANGVGGELLQRSVPQVGTTRVLKLPAAPRDAPDPPAGMGSPQPLPQTAPVRCRLLFIDDNTRFLDTMERLLQRTHTVVTACSGTEAIELLGRDQAFDSVFCDVMMPRVGGLDVYDFVRDHCPALLERFVLVTGGAFTDDARSRLATVSVAVIAKPFPLDQLLALIEARRPRDFSDGG